MVSPSRVLGALVELELSSVRCRSVPGRSAMRWPASEPAGRVRVELEQLVDVDAGLLGDQASVSPSSTIQTPSLDRALALRADGPVWSAVVSLSPPSSSPSAAGRDRRRSTDDEGGDQRRARRPPARTGSASSPATSAGEMVPARRQPAAALTEPAPRARRAAPRPRRPGRRLRRCCARRGPGSMPGGPGPAPGPRSSGRPPCAPTPGIRKIESGISSRRRARCSGRGRADDRAHAAEAALARQPGRALGDELGQLLVQRPPPTRRRPGSRRRRGWRCGPGRRPRRRASAAASISGSIASPPSSGLAVNASAPRPATAPQGVARLPDQRLAVGAPR